MTPENNFLDFMDQASFLALRALGHAPSIQFTWTYLNGVDLEGLRRFHRSLCRGLLSRRIERSPLPFGRHHWVAWPGPDDFEIAGTARPRADITAWIDEQSRLPIDPEYGPPWRLAVQPLTDGGAAVTLVGSHTVADGVGMASAVADAAKGITLDLGYPSAGQRSPLRALREDSRRFFLDLPEMARAVRASLRLLRNDGVDSIGSTPKATAVDRLFDRTVALPSLSVHIGVEQWDRKAAELGGTSNSLVMGFCARLGQRLGWIAPDGFVVLSIPVNERGEGDTRGNALTGVRVSVEPEKVISDLTGLRRDLKAALSARDQIRFKMAAPLPLTPLVPKAMVRRLEGAVGGEAVIGCSNIGELDPAVNRADGTDADFFAIRMAENIPQGHLRRFGGTFFPVGSGRVHGQIFLTIGYCNAEGTTTRQELIESARAVIADFGLTAMVQ